MCDWILFLPDDWPVAFQIPIYLLAAFIAIVPGAITWSWAFNDGRLGVAFLLTGLAPWLAFATMLQFGCGAGSAEAATLGFFMAVFYLLFSLFLYDVADG
jgi:hypothetical protein